MTKTNKKYLGHLAMFFAAIMWGLMSPIGKNVMSGGITAISLATFRMVGGAILFWTASLFIKEDKKVEKGDFLKLFFAGLFGVMLNQGAFILGLSLTSPVNASIITTITPIITMILAALFLKEPITSKKIIGIIIGASGAITLVLNSAKAGSGSSHILGDLIIFASQAFTAFYLTAYKNTVTKYSVVTSMKWMFLFAAFCFIPFSIKDIIATDFTALSSSMWLGITFVVFCSTFIAYILYATSQKLLRPTVLSMYNYIQPIVATLVAVSIGIDTFGIVKGLAMALVFLGVYVVNKSKAASNN